MRAEATRQQKQSAELVALQSTTARLPLTLRPSVNQQLAEWELLFPFEQNRLRNFLHGVDSFSPAELSTLTADLRDLEVKMDVAHWDFSESRNTMENSGQLARSAYYGEWRRAVDQVFAAIDARARASAKAESIRRRLIVTVLPENLPIDNQSLWTRGRRIEIAGDARGLCELLLSGQSGLGGLTAQQAGSDPADVWMIDADVRPDKAIAPSAIPGASCLSYALLNRFRERFLSELNTIPRDTHTASQTITELHQRDWSQWWPPELAGQNRLRNFVVELYLSGNGALIFSNAFVQWAASEVLRRARPHVLVARFGVRSKPKPFTSIAIFEDQTRVSTVPDSDDPENSAIDAAILARYVWLSALRYAEYEQAISFCVSEHLNAAWLVAPSGSALDKHQGSMSVHELHDAMQNWLAV